MNEVGILEPEPSGQGARIGAAQGHPGAAQLVLRLDGRDEGGGVGQRLPRGQPVQVLDAG